MSTMSWNDIETDIQDYYQILGVSRNATPQQIKSAYKKKARELHPDKNIDDAEQATLRFQEIVKIYEVLKDETKRNIYDQYGEKGLEKSGFQFNFDPNNLDSLFEAAFGDNKQDDYTNENILAKENINVSLKELYTGTKKTIHYKFKYKCKNCHGKGDIKNEIIKECSTCNSTGKCQASGYKSISCTDCEGQGTIFAPVSCNKCSGTGTYYGNFGGVYDCDVCDGIGQLTCFRCMDCNGKGTKKKKTGMVSYKTIKCSTCDGEGSMEYTKCNSCKGKGNKSQFQYYTQICKQCRGKGFASYTQMLTCESCHGSGEFSVQNKTTCYVEPGSTPNDTIKLKHSDHDKEVYGIILVKINFIEDDEPKFVRSGANNSNLITMKTISLRQALQGGNFIIDHIDGSKLSVQCSYEVLQINSTKKIIGKGMPLKGVKGQYGDLFVTFKTKMPKQLNQYNIKQISELLPKDNDSCDGFDERVCLSNLNGFDDMELNATRQRRQKRSNSDEKKDGEHVECKQM